MFEYCITEVKVYLMGVVESFLKRISAKVE